MRSASRRAVSLAALCALLLAVPHSRSSAQTLPPAFRDKVVFSGLNQPTAIAFSPDGRVFVAEKRGVIKVYASLTATTPTTFVDMRLRVHNYWDRGLLGLALHPNFPATPYVYVLYAYDGDIGGGFPKWGTPSPVADSDNCPTPPGATTDGCTVSGRLSRLTAVGSVSDGTEQVLIHDWFQQFPSHSIGSLVFGSDGALYATGGDGASFNWADYGQAGSPKNPGGDPPVPVGGTQTPPTAEGGALRSQDLRTVTGTDPVTLAGTLIRIDPNTGAALPDNPLFADPDPNAKRIVASGLRNPFRFTSRPGTNEIWIGDVGWNTWEEIDRIQDPTSASNFGWPCYEGVGRQSSYDNLNLTICENLYAQSGAVKAPLYTYNHSAKIVPGETCSTGSSSVSGITFYTGTTYPAAYQNALFFADYSRQCIWTMLPGSNGVPDPAQIQNFVTGAPGPVQLVTGPGGDIFYADIVGGKIHRIQYFVPNAVISANPTHGRGSPAGELRRQRINAPRSDRNALLLLGPERRRDLRRCDDGSDELHVSEPRRHNRHASGQRHAWRCRHGERRDRRGQRRSRPDDRGAISGPDLEGRRPDLLLGLGDRRAGRPARGFGALVDASDPPLPLRLPLAYGSVVRRDRERILRRPRPRVSVLSGAEAHRD